MTSADIAEIIAAIAAVVASVGVLLVALEIDTGTAALGGSICTLLLGLATLRQSTRASRKATDAADETKQLSHTMNSQLSSIRENEAKRGDAEGYLRGMIESALAAQLAARELLAQNKAEEAARLLISQAEALARAAGIEEGKEQASGTQVLEPTPQPVTLADSLGTTDKPMQVEVIQTEGMPVPVEVVETDPRMRRNDGAF